MIHAPPVNVFCIFMVPCCFIPERWYPGLMGKVTFRFSLFLFWVENAFILVLFMTYEFCLLPFAYLLTFYNLMITSHGNKKLVMNMFRWAILGNLYLVHMILKDTYYLLKILSMLKGCKAADPHKLDDDEEEEISEETKLDLYNEIRIIVMQMYVECTDAFLNELKENEDDEQ
jgi:hypothetical protein